MGRRSRRRPPAEGDAADARAPRGGSRPPRWGDRVLAAADARPKAPWHPFPLVELSVLAGIVLIVLGFLNFEDRDGRNMLLLGLILASLAGLDTAARDHFAGFRSHTLLLAGIPTVLVAAGLFFAKVPWPALVGAAVATFAAAIWFFRGQFRRRSGGLSFRA